jgi:Fic family protein
MQKQKHKLRRDLPKIYSQDLLNNLFRHPYTKIEFVMADLAVSRPTATRYLDELTAINIVHKLKLGKDNYYVNHELYDLLANVNSNIGI